MAKLSFQLSVQRNADNPYINQFIEVVDSRTCMQSTNEKRLENDIKINMVKQVIRKNTVKA